MEKNKLILLTGPTASGKTDLLLQLPSDSYEVVSFDSRQVYQEMEIGTTQPTSEELKQIPHHLIGIISPNQTLDANWYSNTAKVSVLSIWKKGKIPILTAGTGFYLRAFLRGMFPVPKVPWEIQEKLKLWDEGQLRKELQNLDPKTESKILPNDLYRLRRSLSINLMGIRWSDSEQKLEGGFLEEFQPEVFGYYLQHPRDILWKRIEQRSEKILEGMSKEANHLREKYGMSCPGLKVLGYNFALDYHDGKISLRKFQESIVTVHRQYAKKQSTWFSKEILVEPNSWDAILQTIKNIKN